MQSKPDTLHGRYSRKKWRLTSRWKEVKHTVCTRWSLLAQFVIHIQTLPRSGTPVRGCVCHCLIALIHHQPFQELRSTINCQFSQCFLQLMCVWAAFMVTKAVSCSFITHAIAVNLTGMPMMLKTTELIITCNLFPLSPFFTSSVWNSN